MTDIPALPEEGIPPLTRRIAMELMPVFYHDIRRLAQRERRRCADPAR